jgi:isoleucyl-tRNA synthetase
VFQSGWLHLEDEWYNPALAKSWQQLRDLRTAANQVLEQARVVKAIGSSLEANLLVYVADEAQRQQLQMLNRSDSLAGNGVDELRYLLLVSQVELLDAPGRLAGLNHVLKSEELGIAVVPADGKKCDRCWNYSTAVGQSADHPLLCERCVEALEGRF